MRIVIYSSCAASAEPFHKIDDLSASMCWRNVGRGRTPVCLQVYMDKFYPIQEQAKQYTILLKIRFNSRLPLGLSYSASPILANLGIAIRIDKNMATIAPVPPNRIPSR